MKQVSITLFQLSELSNAAKEAARNWYREHGIDDLWYDTVYEDVAQVADILGIDLRTRKVNFKNGESRYDGINIFFSGFSSQGDGACFEGRYSYAKGAAKEIRKYAPQDKTLHRIADELQALQRKHFYRIKARVKHSGHYYHAYCTDVEVELDEFCSQPEDYPVLEVQQQVTQLLRDFMNWIYHSLEKEYDFQSSDESVDENIAGNGYEFTEMGSRVVSVGSLQ